MDKEMTFDQLVKIIHQEAVDGLMVGGFDEMKRRIWSLMATLAANTHHPEQNNWKLEKPV